MITAMDTAMETTMDTAMDTTMDTCNGHSNGHKTGQLDNEMDAEILNINGGQSFSGKVNWICSFCKENELLLICKDAGGFQIASLMRDQQQLGLSSPRGLQSGQIEEEDIAHNTKHTKISQHVFSHKKYLAKPLFNATFPIDDHW